MVGGYQEQVRQNWLREEVSLFGFPFCLSRKQNEKDVRFHFDVNTFLECSSHDVISAPLHREFGICEDNSIVNLIFSSREPSIFI